MLQKKRARYIESFRKAHRQNFKVQIRKQLLHTRNNSKGGLEGYSFDFCRLPSAEDSDWGGNCGNFNAIQQEGNEEAERAIQNLIQQLQKRNIPGQNQTMTPGQFKAILADFRTVMIHDISRLPGESIQAIYQLLRVELESAIRRQYSTQLSLEKEGMVQCLVECLHSLRLTMMLLLSQHINQGGSLDQKGKQSVWLLRQFYSWLSEVKNSLNSIIQLEYKVDYLTNTLVITNQISIFHFYLKELKSLTTILVGYRDLHFQEVALKAFSPDFVDNIVTFMQSYHTPDDVQLLCLAVLLDAGDLQISEFFKNLIKANFLDYAKLRLVLLQNYKNLTVTSKWTEQERLEASLVYDILAVLSQICEHCTSAILWTNGICSQLKYIVDEISSQRIRNYFIEFLLYSMLELKSVELIESLNKHDMMDWTVRILDSQIDRCSDLSSKEPVEIIIQYCLEVLKLFYVIGEEQKANNPKLSTNPYLIKLKYLRGDAVLSRFQAGQDLLDDFFGESSV